MAYSIPDELQLDLTPPSVLSSEEEDKKEDIANIAAGLQRAQGLIPEEARSILEATPEETQQRAAQVEQAIEQAAGPFGKIGLEEEALGLQRTAYSIWKDIADVANQFTMGVAVPIAQAFGIEPEIDPEASSLAKKNKEFLQKIKQYKKEQTYLLGDDSPTIAWKAAAKGFTEAPEVAEPAEYIRDVINNASKEVGGDLQLTAQEAEQITRWGRPEASILEQAVRSIPEVAAFATAGVKFAARGSKEVVDRANRILKEKGFKNGILDADEGQIRDVVQQLMEDVVKGGNTAIGFYTKRYLIPFFRGTRSKLFGRRATQIIRQEQMKGGRYAEASRKIEEARGKVKSARTSGDKKLIDQENAKLKLLQRQRVGLKPTIKKEILLTEVGATAGAIAATKYFEDDTFAPIFGALGGGLTTGIGYDVMRSFATSGSRWVGDLIFDAAGATSLLDDSQLALVARTGNLKELRDMSKAEKNALRDLWQGVRELPEEARAAAFNSLKFFRQLQNDLSELGIPDEVLRETVGKASGIAPFMAARQAMGIDLAAKKPFGKKRIMENLENAIKTRTDGAVLHSNFNKAIENLIEQVPTNRLGEDGQKRFTRFVEQMKQASNTLETELIDETAAMTQLFGQVANLVRNRSIENAFDDKEALENIFSELHRIKESAATQASGDSIQNNLLTAEIDKMMELSEQLVKGTDYNPEGAREFMRLSSSVFEKYFDPNKHLIDLEGGANALASSASKKRSEATGKASSMFEDFIGQDVKVNVTNFVDDLFQAEDTARYTSIIPGGEKSRVLQRLAGVTIPDSPDLRQLALRLSGDSMKLALRNNKPLRDAIQSHMQELSRRTDGAYAAPNYVTFDSVKDLLEAAIIKSNGDNIDNMDVYRYLKAFEDRIDGLPEQLRLELDPIDIQQLSSSFGKKAHIAYSQGNMNVYRKYKSLNENIIDSLDNVTLEEGSTMKQKLVAAKNFYKKQVIERYDPEVNKFGSNLINLKEVNNDYAVDPKYWIDFDKILKGDSAYGDDLARQLEITYGTYDEVSKSYVLDEVTKSAIRNNLQDYITYMIGQQKEVLDNVAYSKGVIGAKDSPLISASVERELGKDELQELPKTILRSNALNALSEKGLIDIKKIEAYNADVEKQLGGTEVYKRTILQLENNLDRVEKKAVNILNRREKSLRTILRQTPLVEAANKISLATASEDTYTTFLNYIAKGVRSEKNYEEAVRTIARNSKVSEEVVRDDIRAITLKALSETAVGDSVEVTPGNFVKSLNGSVLAGELATNSAQYRRILGDEIYENVNKMAQFLNIKERNMMALMTESGYISRVPRGLSVDALTSRTYSIMRGVVSPTYIAAEVGLKAVRQKRANTISKVLADPKTTDLLIDFIETEGANIKEFNKQYTPIILETLAEIRQSDKRIEVEQQLQELERKKYGSE